MKGTLLNPIILSVVLGVAWYMFCWLGPPALRHHNLQGAGLTATSLAFSGSAASLTSMTRLAGWTAPLPGWPRSPLLSLRVDGYEYPLAVLVAPEGIIFP